MYLPIYCQLFETMLPDQNVANCFIKKQSNLQLKM